MEDVTYGTEAIQGQQNADRRRRARQLSFARRQPTNPKHQQPYVVGERYKDMVGDPRGSHQRVDDWQNAGSPLEDANPSEASSRPW